MSYDMKQTTAPSYEILKKWSIATMKIWKSSVGG